MISIERKHHLTIRWTHWINFPVLFIMFWSGLLICRPNDVYRTKLDDDVSLEQWRLQVTAFAKPNLVEAIILAQMRQLPKTEHTTQFKRIEDWNKIVPWSGVRLSDFARHFAPSSGKDRYVDLKTPDKSYYARCPYAECLLSANTVLLGEDRKHRLHR